MMVNFVSFVVLSSTADTVARVAFADRKPRSLAFTCCAGVDRTGCGEGLVAALVAGASMTWVEEKPHLLTASHQPAVLEYGVSSLDIAFGAAAVDAHRAARQLHDE